MNDLLECRLFPPEENRLYAFMAVFIYAATRFWFRLEVHGAENVPLTGGLLLAANHASNLDPTTIACGLPRQCHFLAKEELFEKPALGPFLRQVNTHAIKRSGSDRAAIRQCVDLLKQGRMLLIFPEGTRTRDGKLQEPKAGAAMIAAQSGARICPVFIDGTFEAMPRGVSRPRREKVRVFVGEAFKPDEVLQSQDRRDRLAELSRAIMDRIAAQREKAIQFRNGSR